jgi:hypothetical protein
MASTEFNSLNFTAQEAAKKLGATQLDVTRTWDAQVLTEAGLLQTWAGVTAMIAHAKDGTAARTNGLITVDRSELDYFFGKFIGDEYKTAIFFGLAHEFGHLCQFKHFGVSETIASTR